VTSLVDKDELLVLVKKLEKLVIKFSNRSQELTTNEIFTNMEHYNGTFNYSVTRNRHTVQPVFPIVRGAQ
jgi:hypothetical protein